MTATIERYQRMSTAVRLIHAEVGRDVRQKWQNWSSGLSALVILAGRRVATA
jgi:hypothetical protein